MGKPTLNQTSDPFGPALPAPQGTNETVGNAAKGQEPANEPARKENPVT